MSRTIRKFPRQSDRKPKLVGEMKVSSMAVEAMEEEGYTPTNRVKVKGNYKYAGDDFPMYVWDQVPHCLR